MILNEKLPMDESNNPGMLDQIQTAVRPITQNGDFYLTSITHEEMYGDVDVLLTSKEFNIQFHILLKVSGTFRCIFHVNTVKKSLNADTLFRACKINIPLKTDFFAPPIDY
jgi:hypothetical protein